jgi:hypothetical protein
VTSARNYSSIAASAALTSGCSNVDTTIQVDTTSGFPSVPFLLTIDKDRVAEELVLCTAIVGLALTVTRGYDGTSATAHTAAAIVKHVVAGVDLQDAGNHVGDSTLHWNSTNTDTLELPWQFSKPGVICTGLTTGTPTTISSAGPTSILAGPASGRRVIKNILITGAKGATVTVTAASVNIAKFMFPNGSGDPAKNTVSLTLALPIANGESVTATVASGAATFTPVYADRSGTSFTRLGLVSGSTTGNIIASGTARTITQLWIANCDASTTATGSVLRAGTTIIDSVSLIAGAVCSFDDPFTITNAQALTYSGDSATALTYFAVGI